MVSKITIKPKIISLAIIYALSGATALSANVSFAAQTANNAQVARQQVSIPAGKLSDVLAQFAATLGVPLSFEPSMLANIESKGLQGNYSVKEGFAALLSGTGYQLANKGNDGYSLQALSNAIMLEAVEVSAELIRADDLPEEYSGGQVAKGANLGMLGNTDFMDAPFNNTSYTSELIESQQAHTLANIIDDDPSVQVSSRGRGTNVSGGEAYYIRGFLVRNQDVSMNGLYGVLPRNTISMEGTERVEIMKGPNALLNGVSPWGSVGGSINIVPKRAMDEPLTRITAMYRSDTQLGAHLDVGRRFGDENQFGIRFNGVYKGGDTAVEHQTSMLGMASIGMDYRGERLRLSGDMGYQKDRTDGASGFGSGLKVSDASSVPDAIDPSESTAQDWERTENKDVYVALHAEYDLTSYITLYGGAGGRNNTPYNLRTNHTLIDSEGTLASFPVYYPEYSDTRTVMSGVRANFYTGSVSHKVNFQTSMFWFEGGYLYESGDNYLSNLNNVGYIEKPNFNTSSKIPKGYERYLSSFAISDTMGFLDDQILLTLGARNQRVEVNNFNPSTGEQTSEYDERITTPAIGVAFKPSKFVTFYGNYIEGLSLGYTAPASAENAGESFAPSKTQQTEVGIKIDSGNFGSTLSAFEISQPSFIQKSGSDASSFIYTEDGEQRNRGVEWQIFGQLTSNLRLLGGVAYLQPKLTNTQNGVNDGNQAPGVSRWTSTVSADWDMPFLSGLSVNTRLIQSSSQYGNATNTLKKPGWTRVDLGATYQFQKSNVILRANIENLFDNHYWESFGGSGGRLRLAEPRYLTISATMDF